MWVCTQDGFFSITRVPEMLDRSQIRARSERHLANLKATVRAAYGVVDRGISDEIAKAEIVQKPHGDYKYRILVSPEAVSQVMNLYGQLVTYDNFKNAVSASQQSSDDDNYYQFLTTVWSLGFSLED